MRSLLLLSALALAACGSDTSEGVSAAPAETVASDLVPCDILSADAVAGALGLSAGEVAIDTEWMESFDAETYCRYTVPAGDFDSITLTLRTYDDADGAEGTFSSQYRTMTDADLAQVEEAADRATEELEAQGRAEDLEGVDAGAMLSGLASKFTFEAIDGAGDQAVIETNHIMDPAVPTTVHVREGAAIYSVEVASSFELMRADGGPEQIGETLAALARAAADR